VATLIAFIVVFLYFVSITFVLLRILSRLRKIWLVLVLPFYWLMLAIQVIAFQPIEKLLVSKNIYLDFGHAEILWINILVIEFITSGFILIYYYWSGKSD
jgi:hypothetical protein